MSVSSSPSSAGTTDPNQPQTLDDYVNQQLGAYKQAYDLSPEIRQVIKNAWDPVNKQPRYPATTVIANIEQTNWWKENGGNIAKALGIQITDPQQWNQILRANLADVNKMATDAGVYLTDAQRQQLAADKFRLNWDDTEFREQLMGAAGQNGQNQFNAAAPTTSNIGQVDTAMKQMQSSANDYGVKLDDRTAFQWAMDIAAGHKTAEDYTPVFQQWAQQLYPSLAPLIHAGVTVQQALDPYKQQAGSLLEKGGADIDIVNNPQWMKAFFTTDPTSGQQQLRSLTDSATTIRSDDSFGWKATKNGQQAASQMAEGILREFGKVGGATQQYTTGGTG